MGLNIYQTYLKESIHFKGKNNYVENALLSYKLILQGCKIVTSCVLGYFCILLLEKFC